MRRFLAILLLAAVGLPVAVPALALTDSPDAHLPACCRRNGAHHCAMNFGKSSGAPAFRSVCPEFPRLASTTPAGTMAALASVTNVSTSAVVEMVVAAASTRQRYLLYKQTHPKRGPPTQAL